MNAIITYIIIIFIISSSIIIIISSTIIDIIITIKTSDLTCSFTQSQYTDLALTL